MQIDRRLAAGLVAGAALLAACGSSSASPAASSSSSQSSASTASTTTSSSATSAAAAAVVQAKTGDRGPMLVAVSNGMTLYTFARDSANSGQSACSGGCAATWPPLTVAAGQTSPTGTGVTGALATIQRTDGTTQVTYRGLPLYFFSGDKAAGDTHGVYTNWALATP